MPSALVLKTLLNELPTVSLRGPCREPRTTLNLGHLGGYLPYKTQLLAGLL